jgi:hypothetical protein
MSDCRKEVDQFEWKIEAVLEPKSNFSFKNEHGENDPLKNRWKSVESRASSKSYSLQSASTLKGDMYN